MNTKSILSIIFSDITSFGSLVFFLLVSILFLFLGRVRETLLLLSGLGIILFIVLLCRTFYHKERPQQQEHATFIERIDARSFPSIHSARAFFLAIMLSYFVTAPFSSMFFLSLAVLVGYSRIFLKKHDVVDVFGGGVLGVLTGLLLSTMF